MSISLALTLVLIAPASESQFPPRQPIAQMVRVEGKVELKPQGQPNYRPVQVNERLYHGDLLRVERGGRGVIRCTADATTWTIPADGLPRGVANTCSPPSTR
ncbi:hypothetical protein ACN4EK_24850 [Pantanalinema rosaneae CENA516]|uniref:hypothetical protein n=1 Tax=Pantanalinema rosaneae TaxID=1620701 RepID=UPI003D6F97B0